MPLIREHDQGPVRIDAACLEPAAEHVGHGSRRREAAGERGVPQDRGGRGDILHLKPDLRHGARSRCARPRREGPQYNAACAVGDGEFHLIGPSVKHAPPPGHLESQLVAVEGEGGVQVRDGDRRGPDAVRDARPGEALALVLHHLPIRLELRHLVGAPVRVLDAEDKVPDACRLHRGRVDSLCGQLVVEGRGIVRR